MAATFAYLRDLRPYTTSWRIQVKILHTWIQQEDGDILNMVLADEKGTKIHAVVNKENLMRCAKYLIEGSWRFIENFSLNHASGHFRTTNHVYKLSFNSETSVKISEEISNSDFLSLVSFPSIITGDYKHSHIRDIMGQIVNIGEFEQIEDSNNLQKKLQFLLRDVSGQILECVLWNSFAEHVLKSSKEYVRVPIVCVIRFAKFIKHQDSIIITNASEFTQVRINPPIPEVEAFKHMLTTSKHYYDIVLHDERSIPITTIAQLIASTKVGQVNLQCQIYGIDKDWGWSYLCCLTCNKKIKQVGTTGSSTNKSSSGLEQIFWCGYCNSNVTNVMARYKLHLNVNDNSGETKLICFDNPAFFMVNLPASALLPAPFNQSTAYTTIPDRIQKLIGQTFIFSVSVEQENIFEGLDTFKVNRVISDDLSITKTLHGKKIFAPK